MSAREVRELRVCVGCERLGDRRNMIGWNGGYSHGACIIKGYGVSELLLLSSAELRRLTLDDIGVDAMAAIHERREQRGAEDSDL